MRERGLFMAKKLHDVSGRRSAEVLEADYEASERFDNLSVGRIGVYYRDGFRIKHIPYDYMERVFLRIQEVSGKMCCGSTVFQYFRMVFVCGGKEIADAIGEDEKAYRAALERIKENAPELKYGVEEKQ